MAISKQHDCPGAALGSWQMGRSRSKHLQSTQPLPPLWRARSGLQPIPLHSLCFCAKVAMEILEAIERSSDANLKCRCRKTLAVLERTLDLYT